MSIRFRSVPFAAVATADAEAAAQYLRSFASSVLTRAADLTIAVHGRYDPDEQEPGKQFVVVSDSAYNQFIAAVNMLLRWLREQTGSSAAFTSEEPLALEAWSVGEVQVALQDLLRRYYDAAPASAGASTSKKGPWLFIGWLVIGAGVVYARS